MKKIMFVLSLFVFTASAPAAVYKWVDDKGVVNFADDLDRVPPAYRNSVEEIKTPKMPAQNAPPGKASAIAPPIGQVLVREGDFAMKLIEVLKVGQVQNEAEAESLLASIGITPKNGWIADYPMTPDIIGELQNVLGGAADSGKLSIKKDEAMKVFHDLVTQQGLPVRADERQHPGMEQSDAEVAPPQDYPEYYEPSKVENYYYDQGPPVVTYYPPPWDYNYLYAWVPYPFWWSGFWFRGFFVLHDFHRGVHHDHGIHGHSEFVSNHFRDPKTGRLGTIDPAKRYMGNTRANITESAKGFTSLTLT